MARRRRPSRAAASSTEPNSCRIYPAFSMASPISQNMGGQSPTNRARRSALPRSSWSTVLARIHSPMQSPIDPTDAACRYTPRRPARRSASPVVTHVLLPAKDGMKQQSGVKEQTMTTTSGRDRLGILLRWPLGIALVSWRYMWRTTPLHRSEEAGGREDLPAAAADAAADPAQDGVQPIEAGTGPMLHRTYAVRIAGSDME